MAFQQLPLFRERDARRQEQIALRYQWCRDALKEARESLCRGDLLHVVRWLVHAEIMRESAREWRQGGPST